MRPYRYGEDAVGAVGGDGNLQGHAGVGDLQRDRVR
jgi:hypothetical protein